MKNISDENCRENLNTFLISTALFFENCAVYEKCGNMFRAGQATDDTP
jgi:hypothetical protein